MTSAEAALDSGAGAPPGAPVSLSVAADAADAAARLAAGLEPADPALVLLFGSPREALAPVAEALAAALPGAEIAGCSSAGEIGAAGYQRGTIVAIGFPRAAFRAEVVALEDQASIPVSGWLARLRRLRAGFPDRAGAQLFGILLAGFVPLGAIMPALAPAHKGAAMAMYTTAAGGATFLGSAVVAIVRPWGGDVGVVWAFVVLYGLAFLMTFALKVDQPRVGKKDIPAAEA